MIWQTSTKKSVSQITTNPTGKQLYIQFKNESQQTTQRRETTKHLTFRSKTTWNKQCLIQHILPSRTWNLFRSKTQSILRVVHNMNKHHQGVHTTSQSPGHSNVMGYAANLYTYNHNKHYFLEGEPHKVKKM